MGIDLLEDIGRISIFSLPLYLWIVFLYLESDSQLILSLPLKYCLYNFSHDIFSNIDRYTTLSTDTFCIIQPR